MSFSVHVTSAAETDVAEALEWYESQHLGLGQGFLDEFEAVIAVLSETPLIYQELIGEARRAVLHRFPYLVWFVVRGRIVTVIACTHGKINPAALPRRLR